MRSRPACKASQSRKPPPTELARQPFPEVQDGVAPRAATGHQCGMSILVIPDIHGHKAELTRVLHLADTQCGPDARIVFLGDLVDRGPDSRGVIQLLIDGLAAGRDWIVLRGNHDQRFLDFLSDAEHQASSLQRGSGWLSDNNGGIETLYSYGAATVVERGNWAAAAGAVPKDHRAFLHGLPLYHETDAHLFVHAGIRPGVALADQDPHDLLWIRDEFLRDTRDHGKLVVHGHTPVEEPTHYGNRVNLDAATGWGQPLNVVKFDGRHAWRLTGAGPVPLKRGDPEEW